MRGRAEHRGADRRPRAARGRRRAADAGQPRDPRSELRARGPRRGHRRVVRARRDHDGDRTVPRRMARGVGVLALDLRDQHPVRRDRGVGGCASRAREQERPRAARARHRRCGAHDHRARRRHRGPDRRTGARLVVALGAHPPDRRAGVPRRVPRRRAAEPAPPGATRDLQGEAVQRREHRDVRRLRRARRRVLPAPDPAPDRRSLLTDRGRAPRCSRSR